MNLVQSETDALGVINGFYILTHLPPCIRSSSQCVIQMIFLQTKRQKNNEIIYIEHILSI